MRVEKGLTQEEIARRAGMSLKGMGDLERGVATDPHFSTLVGIARALGVSVLELVECVERERERQEGGAA
ncbi:MAG: helix-turn-helix transcriptional regulator [Actinomycetota bacterium]|nr:helix-turn-helix transcriptional regulator [Actinomycetota bacterium]